MLNMAAEEKDHLQWCEKRISELNGKTSILNPFWFAGSVIIGMLSSISNDKNGLGFIEETEKQVKEHLEESILQLPKNDYRSRDFLVQIANDEEKHRETVKNIGSNEIPDIIRKAMQTSSNIMKKLTSLI